MEAVSSESIGEPPLAWLVHSVATGYSDAPVSDLLDSAEERDVRAVLPPEFFGWLRAEADETVAVVRDLNNGDSNVPYADVERAASRVLTELSIRLAFDDPGRNTVVVAPRLAAPAARLGIEASLVVQSMRIMERRWVAQFLAAAKERVAEVAPSVLAASASVYDPIVDEFVGDYVAEEGRIQGEALAHKRALVDALLIPGVRDAGPFLELGIDLSAHHVGVVLSYAAAGVGAQLETISRQLGARTLATSVLAVPGDDRSLWLWLSFASEPTNVVFDRIRSFPVESDRLRIAVGPIDVGVAGFRRTHLLARDYSLAASRLRTDMAPAIADAESVSFLSLLLRDRERAEWFVATELGPMGTGKNPSDVEKLRDPADLPGVRAVTRRDRGRTAHPSQHRRVPHPPCRTGNRSPDRLSAPRSCTPPPCCHVSFAQQNAELLRPTRTGVPPRKPLSRPAYGDRGDRPMAR